MSRIVIIKRWCPTCQCLRDETEWKIRRHYYECLHCCTEVKAVWQDRFQSILDHMFGSLMLDHMFGSWLYTPMDKIDTLIYAVGYKYRALRQRLRSSR